MTANRFAGSALLVLGLIIAAAGGYLGIFAWMNDGAAAGLGLMLVTGGAAGSCNRQCGQDDGSIHRM